MPGQVERDIAASAQAPLARGLSARLLFLTILFVLLAEILIFLPSIADFKRDWLRDRLSMAATASLVLLAADFEQELPPDARDDVLLAIGAKAVAIREA